VRSVHLIFERLALECKAFLLNSNWCSIDNIELNVSSVAVDVGSASRELTTAAEYQRRAGKRAACLMLVLAVVVAVVLLAVSACVSFGYLLPSDASS